MVRRPPFVSFIFCIALFIGLPFRGSAHLIINISAKKKWQKMLNPSSYIPPQRNETPSQALNSLQSLPSLNVKKLGGMGGITTLSFRGQTSPNTHLRIDDIPVQDPGGAINFSPLFGGATHINQILPGSHGVRYGSGASGGVVLMDTPFLSSNNLITLERGSFQSAYSHIAHQKKTDSTQFVLHGEGSRTAGLPQYGKTRKFGEKARNQSVHLATRLEHAITHNTTFKFTARTLENNGKYDTYDTHSNLLPKPQGNQSTNLSLISMGLDTETPTTHHSLKGFSSYQKSKYTSTPMSSFLLNGANYTGIYTFSPRLESTFLGGVEHHQIQVNSALRKLMNTGYGGWIQKARLTKSMSAEIGIRGDHHQKFGTTPTYSVLVAYAHHHTLLKGGIRTGFLNPTLYALYLSNDFVQSNPHLKPEKTQTVDISWQQNFPNHHVSFQVTPFWTRAQKMIHSVLQNGKYHSVNAPGTSSLSGLETQFFYTPDTSFKLTASHTYTNLDFNQININPEFPKHKAHVHIEYWMNESISLAPDLLYVGKRRSYQGSSLKEYSVLNLSLNYQIKAGSSLFARIENIADTRYVQTHNYQTPGRSFYVGTHLYF